MTGDYTDVGWALAAAGISLLCWAWGKLMSGPDIPTLVQMRNERRDRQPWS